MNMNNFPVVYLSGQITGIDREEAEKRFNVATMRVKCMMPDAAIINPLELPQDQPNWAKYIIRDLDHLMYSDYIYMVDGWTHSKGAILERYFALGADIPVLNDILTPEK